MFHESSKFYARRRTFPTLVAKDPISRTLVTFASCYKALRESNPCKSTARARKKKERNERRSSLSPSNTRQPRKSQENHSPKKSQVHETQKPKSPKEKVKINTKSRDTERKKWSSKTREKVQNAGQKES